MMNIAQIGAINTVVNSGGGGGGGSPITYFGSASTPLDNGSEGAATPVAVTPPASMVAGQLVLMSINTSSATTASMSVTGGQTWNALAEITGGGGIRFRTFWAIFDGTWAANPSIATGGGAGDLNTVVMHVFSPSTGHTTWAIDVAQTSSFAFPSGGVYTIPSRTSTQNSALNYSVIAITGASTFSGLSGGSWTITGDPQYRNLFSADNTLVFTHYIQTSAGATGTATITASAPTPGTQIGVTFYSS